MLVGMIGVTDSALNCRPNRALLRHSPVIDTSSSSCGRWKFPTTVSSSFDPSRLHVTTVNPDSGFTNRTCTTVALIVSTRVKVTSSTIRAPFRMTTTNVCGLDFGTSNSEIGIVRDGAPVLVDVENDRKQI